jgi:hypothetical protein
VLRRFKTTTPQDFEDAEIAQLGDSSTWKDLRNLLQVAVTDTSKVEAKALGRAIHSLQVHNALYRYENEGLRDSLNAKQKYRGKSKPLNLQQRKEFHSTAVFWSPSTIREARVRERVQRCEDEAAQLKKKVDKKLKAPHRLYQKRVAEEAKAARLRDREAKKKEREAMAAELAAARAKKKQERDAATLQKSHNTANTANRAAS